jgi:hypothetical protein
LISHLITKYLSISVVIWIRYFGVKEMFDKLPTPPCGIFPDRRQSPEVKNFSKREQTNMQRLATTIFITALAVITLIACDAIPGFGKEEPPPASAPMVQPVQQAVPQPTAAPGQPMAAPLQPGMPAQAQPAAVQPGVQVPGQPVAIPGVQQPGMIAPTQQVTPPTPTGDALTDKLNAKKFELASAFIPTSALVKQNLEKNKSQAYQVQLPGPPYCHTYVAVTGDQVGNIDLAIDSPAGTTEAKDATEESVASILNHCPVMPGAYKLTVSMPQAGGEFAVQVFSK